jgi:hypothetical protein
MTHDPNGPHPIGLDDPVIAACAAWGAEVRRHGNRKHARALMWDMVSPPQLRPVPTELTEDERELEAADCAETLGRWADDGGAREDLTRATEGVRPGQREAA